MCAVGASPSGTLGASRTTLSKRIRTGRLTLYVCAVENPPPPQPPATPTDLLVLHTLRCIGVSELARIADAAGLSDDDTESELIDLGAAGLATYRSGVFTGWGLTEAGRAIDAERIADELHAAHAQSAVANAYDAFLPLNAELLDVCTAWQTRTMNGAMAMNDHHDADYDGAVLHRLEALHQRVGGPLVALATTLPRFDRYRARLSDALRRARAGALEYVTDGVASYHTVWFQLHEDLLVTLGIPRH